VFSEAQYKHHVFPHFFVGRISTRSCDSRTVKIIALRALLIEIMGSEDMGSKMHLFVWLMRAPTKSKIAIRNRMTTCRKWPNLCFDRSPIMSPVHRQGQISATPSHVSPLTELIVIVQYVYLKLTTTLVQTKCVLLKLFLPNSKTKQRKNPTTEM